jgi:hypothetical protein
MDYNIHIHLPDGQQPEAGPVKETPQNKIGTWHDRFLDKIRQCYNWRSLYEFNEEFACVGLTIRDTSGGRKILCRMEEGIPITDKIVDDYIFIGSKDAIDEEVSQRAMEVIVNFIGSSSSQPQTIMTDGQKYTKDVALYGQPLQIYQEETNAQQQEIETMGRMLKDDTMSEFINNYIQSNGEI